MKFRNVNVTLERTTNYSGGHHDYRPGCEGMVPHRMSATFLENVDDLRMQGVIVRWKTARVWDWGLPFDFAAGTTVRGMHLQDYESSHLD